MRTGKRLVNTAESYKSFELKLEIVGDVVVCYDRFTLGVLLNSPDALSVYGRQGVRGKFGRYTVPIKFLVHKLHTMTVKRDALNESIRVVSKVLSEAGK